MSNILKINFIPGYILKSRDLEHIQDILRNQISKTSDNYLGNVYITSYDEFKDEVYLERSIVTYKDFVVEIDELRVLFEKEAFKNKQLYLTLYEVLNSDTEPATIGVKYELVLDTEDKAKLNNYFLLKNKINQRYLVNYVNPVENKIEFIKPFKINMLVYNSTSEIINFTDGILKYNNKLYYKNLSYLDTELILNKLKVDSTYDSDYTYNSDKTICKAFYAVYSPISDDFNLQVIKKGGYVDLNLSILIEVPLYDRNYYINNYSKYYSFLPKSEVISDEKLIDNFKYYTNSLYLEHDSDNALLIYQGQPLICRNILYNRWLTQDVKIVENSTNFEINENGEVNYLHTKSFNYVDDKVKFDLDRTDIKLFDHDNRAAHIELATPIKMLTNKDMTFLNRHDLVMFIRKNLNKVIKYDVVETPNLDLRINYGLVYNADTSSITALVKSCDRKNLDYSNGLIIGKVIDISNSSYQIQQGLTQNEIDTVDTSLNVNGYTFKTMYPDFNLIIDKDGSNTENVGFDKTYNLYFKFSQTSKIIEYFQDSINIKAPTLGQFTTNHFPSDINITNLPAFALNHYYDNKMLCNKFIDFQDSLTHHILLNFDLTLLAGNPEFFYPVDENAHSIRNYNSFLVEDKIQNIEDNYFSLKSNYSDEPYVFPEMHRIGNTYINNNHTYENFISNFPYKKSYLSYNDSNINLWIMATATTSTSKVYGRFKINLDSFLNINYLNSKPININNSIDDNIPAQLIKEVILYEQSNTGDISPEMARQILNGEIIGGSIRDSYFCYIYKKAGDNNNLYITIKSNNTDFIGVELYSLEFSLNISNLYNNYYHLIKYFINKSLTSEKKIYAIQTNSGTNQDTNFDTRINNSNSITNIIKTFNSLEESDDIQFYKYEIYDKMVIGKNKTVENLEYYDSVRNLTALDFITEAVRSDVDIYNIRYVRAKYSNDLFYYTYNGPTENISGVQLYSNSLGKFGNYLVNNADLKQLSITPISSTLGSLCTKRFDCLIYTKEYYQLPKGNFDDFNFQTQKDCVIKKFNLKINPSAFNTFTIDSLLFFGVLDEAGNCLYANVNSLNNIHNNLIELYIHDHITFKENKRYILKLKTYKCKLSINFSESYISYADYIEPKYNYLISSTDQQVYSAFDEAGIGDHLIQNALLRGSKNVYELNSTDRLMYLNYLGYGNYKSPVLNQFYTQTLLRKAIPTDFTVLKTMDVDFLNNTPTSFNVQLEFIREKQDDYFLLTPIDLDWKLYFYNDNVTQNYNGENYYVIQNYAEDNGVVLAESLIGPDLIYINNPLTYTPINTEWRFDLDKYYIRTDSPTHTKLDIPINVTTSCNKLVLYLKVTPEYVKMSLNIKKINLIVNYS